MNENRKSHHFIQKPVLLLLTGLLSIVLTFHLASAEKRIPYDEGLQEIKKHIKAKDFQSSEDLLQTMLTQRPDNTELLSILAHVLYWQNKHDESIEVYKKLLQIRPSRENIEGLEKVTFSKEYREIELLQKRKNVKEAEERLKRLYHSGKTTYRAGYRLGMLYIRQREYEKAHQIFSELKSLYPDDKGFEALYIESLILMGEIKKAKEKLHALPDDKKTSLYSFRDDLFYRVKRNYLMIKGELYDYTRGIEDGKKYSIRLRQRLFEKTFVLNYSNVQRFGKTDNQFGMDIYSKLGEKTKRWGYVSFTASPDADFLPEWTIGGEIYQGYKNFDFSAGYTHMQFGDSSVDRIMPGVIIYLPYSLALTEKLYFNLNRGTTTLLSKIHYEPNHKFQGFYSFAYGKSAEEIDALQDVIRFETYSHRLGIEYRLKEYLSIGAEYYFSHRKTLYDTEGIAIFSKYWW